MKVSKAGKIWLDYHQINSKKNTVRAHSFVMDRFRHQFGDYELGDLSIDNILDFMNQLTEGRKPQTKRGRFSQLSSFFNFVRNNIDPELRNPCDRPMIRKPYRERVPLRWKIIEKETWGRSFPAPPFTATASTAASSCSIPSTFTTTSS